MHVSNFSSALLAKLGDVSPKIKKKYAYITNQRGMIKARPVTDNINFSGKSNFSGT